VEPTADYLETLKKRAKDSHVHREYQLTGLEIAEILGDEKHKSLYIRLAKNGDAQELRRLAKTVADTRNVKNKGAYFMSILSRKSNPNLRMHPNDTNKKTGGDTAQ
jgi:hypothetical protein